MYSNIQTVRNGFSTATILVCGPLYRRRDNGDMQSPYNGEISTLTRRKKTLQCMISPVIFFSLKKNQSILLYSNIYEQQSAIAISYKVVYLRIFSSVKTPSTVGDY